MVKNYIPERGDIVWISFNPQAGKEQSGHRPAIVLSHKEYNKRIGLAIMCPITNKVKGYPFEVAIKFDEIKGVMLADHIKNLDWKERNASFIGKAPEHIIEEVTTLINTIIRKQ
jgi:mRNA interferase MazF